MLKSGGENDKEESDGEHLNHVRDGSDMVKSTNKRKCNDSFEARCHGYFTRALSGVPDCQNQGTSRARICNGPRRTWQKKNVHGQTINSSNRRYMSERRSVIVTLFRGTANLMHGS